jgi:hypothetical protein
MTFSCASADREEKRITGNSSFLMPVDFSGVSLVQDYTDFDDFDDFFFLVL